MNEPKDIGAYAGAGFTAELHKQVEAACEKAGEALTRAALAQGDRGLAQAQGFFAEHWHTETFNVDAVLKRIHGVRAETVGSTALRSPDIRIHDGDRIAAEYSSKYYATGRDTVNAQKGYDGQERLAPSDQIDSGREFLRRQIPKDRVAEGPNRAQNAADLEDVDRHLKDRLEHEGIRSRPMGRSESESKYRETRRGDDPGLRPEIDGSVMAKEAAKAGAVAAGISLGLHLAPKIYGEIAHRVKHGEFREDCLQRIAEGSGDAALTAGVRGSVASAVITAAKAGWLGEAARNVTPAMVGTLTFLAIEGIKDYRRVLRGEISGEQYGDLMLGKSVAATAGVYGAVIGQTLIPVPVVGAMIGATLGSLVGNSGYRLLDGAVETWFRSESLKKLAIINTEIAAEWNNFLDRHARWQGLRALHSAVEGESLRRLAALQSEEEELDRRIAEELENDSWR